MPFIIHKTPARTSPFSRFVIYTVHGFRYKVSSFGSTPLMEAASQNWYEGVYLLLEAGADFRIASDRGITLAEFAVSEDVPYTAEVRQWKDKVLDFLDKHGADLETARRKVEAKGIRTKKWEPGEVHKPDIREYRGAKSSGSEST